MIESKNSSAAENLPVIPRPVNSAALFALKTRHWRPTLALMLIGVEGMGGGGSGYMGRGGQRNKYTSRARAFFEHRLSKRVNLELTKAVHGPLGRSSSGPQSTLFHMFSKKTDQPNNQTTNQRLVTKQINSHSLDLKKNNLSWCCLSFPPLQDQ